MQTNISPIFFCVCVYSTTVLHHFQKNEWEMDGTFMSRVISKTYWWPNCLPIQVVASSGWDMEPDRCTWTWWNWRPWQMECTAAWYHHARCSWAGQDRWPSLWRAKTLARDSCCQGRTPSSVELCVRALHIPGSGLDKYRMRRFLSANVLKYLKTQGSSTPDLEHVSPRVDQ